jgi:hypothetical protein
VGTSVDKREVLQVLVSMTLDGVNLNELGCEVALDLVRDRIAILDVFGNDRCILVQKRVGVQRRVEDQALLQNLDHLLEDALVAHAPRDTSKIDLVNVLSLQELVDSVIGALLRDVVPSVRVDFSQLLDHAQLAGRSESNHLLIFADVNGEVIEASSSREVEVVLECDGRVRAHIAVHALGNEALVDRDGTNGDLHQQINSLHGTGNVGENNVAAIDPKNIVKTPVLNPRGSYVLVDQELFLLPVDVFVDLNTTIVGVSLARIEVILTHENGHAKITISKKVCKRCRLTARQGTP